MLSALLVLRAELAALQQRSFLAAGWTPRRPDVDHHRGATQLTEVDRAVLRGAAPGPLQPRAGPSVLEDLEAEARRRRGASARESVVDRRVGRLRDHAVDQQGHEGDGQHDGGAAAQQPQGAAAILLNVHQASSEMPARRRHGPSARDD
jgi:hypothetical protein